MSRIRGLLGPCFSVRSILRHLSCGRGAKREGPGQKISVYADMSSRFARGCLVATPRL